MYKKFVDKEKDRSIGLRLIALYGFKLVREERYNCCVAKNHFEYYFCEWEDLLGMNNSPIWSLNTHIKKCNVDIPIIDFTCIEELEIKLTLAGY